MLMKKELIENNKILLWENRKQKEEIERLIISLQAQEELTMNEHIKVERLNNIINEFDKLIENEINESKLEDNYERVDSLEYCLATLKELKGSDKE